MRVGYVRSSTDNQDLLSNVLAMIAEFESDLICAPDSQG